MTKTQAIERVNKLLALAKGSSNPHERDAASRQAAELKLKHHITDTDLSASGKSAAFDRLADILGEYSAKHPDLQQNTFGAAQVIGEIITHSKRNLDSTAKAALLDKISSGLTLASTFFRNNQTVRDLQGILDSVLKSHNL